MKYFKLNNDFHLQMSFWLHYLVWHHIIWALWNHQTGISGWFISLRINLFYTKSGFPCLLNITAVCVIEFLVDRENIEQIMEVQAVKTKSLALWKTLIHTLVRIIISIDFPRDHFTFGLLENIAVVSQKCLV